MVTKQQQLEWLAKHIEKWKSGYTYAVVEKSTDGHLYVRWPSICTSGITKKEWRQERDKMNSKQEVDNSWHEREELPPVGCECEWVDESGVDGVDGVVYPQLGDVVTIHAHADTPGGYTIAIFTWARGSGLGVAASRMQEDFRPIRTEREKAIDAACKAIGGVIGARLVIERLYDAGMLK